MRHVRMNKSLLLAGFVGAALVTGCVYSEQSPSDSEAAMALRAEQSGSTDSKKTYVCHIPPGNPANAHTIHIGNPAVDAHLAHGCYVGRCADLPPDTTSTGSGSEGGSEGGAEGGTETGSGTETGGSTETGDNT